VETKTQSSNDKTNKSGGVIPMGNYFQPEMRAAA